MINLSLKDIFFLFKMVDDKSRHLGTFSSGQAAAHTVIKVLDFIHQDFKTGQGQEIRDIGDDAIISGKDGIAGYGVEVGRTIQKDIVVAFKVRFHRFIEEGVGEGKTVLMNLVFDGYHLNR